MNVFYTDCFVLPLPETHRFPMRKYSLLRERLVADEIVPPGKLHLPEAADDQQLLRAHGPDYVRRVTSGELTRHEIRRIGFPWSPELVERSRRSARATVEAGRAALRDGLGVNLAGGTHHASRDAGEGYCVFNDSIIAARTLQAEAAARRVLVVDCDVHQGNGTAAIAAGDETIFTVSMHGARNFPSRKVPSDLDVPLQDDTGDEEYLDMLQKNLPRAVERARPDLVIYVSGADPFLGDCLGRLALSKRGLAARDRYVYEVCRSAGLPVAVSMAGGYADDVNDIVDIHFETVRLAATVLT